MTSEEIKNRLVEVAALSDKQQNGSYTTESDAQTALHLCGTIARLMAEMLKTVHPDVMSFITTDSCAELKKSSSGLWSVRRYGVGKWFHGQTLLAACEAALYDALDERSE